MADMLYGQLTEGAISVDYTGLTTATSQTTVDNLGRTIGVNVLSLPHTFSLQKPDGTLIVFDGSTNQSVVLTRDDTKLDKPVNPVNNKIYIPCYQNGAFVWIALDDIVRL